MSKRSKRVKYNVWNKIKSHQFVTDLRSHHIKDEEIDLFCIKRSGDPTNKRKRSKIGIIETRKDN